MNGNAIAIHFWGLGGYGPYYGYGCMTKEQFDFVQLVVKGNKWRKS